MFVYLVMAKFSLSLIFIAFFATCGAEQYTTTTTTLHLPPPLNNEKLSIARSLIDTIIDGVLNKIKTEVNEPIVLQDEIAQFNKSLLLIPIRGEVVLYNGKLSGVRTIQRASEAHFTVRNLHDVVVNCSFQFEKLNFTYDFQANLYNKVSTDGRINGNMLELLADAGMEINLKTKIIELTSFTLKTANERRGSVERLAVVSVQEIAIPNVSRESLSNDEFLIEKLLIVFVFKFSKLWTSFSSSSVGSDGLPSSP